MASERGHRITAAQEFAPLTLTLPARPPHPGLLDDYEFIRFYGHLEAHMAHMAARRERASAAFQRFDTDRSGLIDRMEFHQAVVALGVVRANSDAAAAVQSSTLFAAADANGDGALSFEEFAAWYSDAEDKDKAEKERDGRAQKLFAELAAASGGMFIEKAQFWNALLRLGLFDGLTVEQAVDKVNEQYALADVDNSGVLDAAEFVRYYSLMESMQALKRHSSAQSPAGSTPGSPSAASFLTAHSPGRVPGRASSHGGAGAPFFPSSLFPSPGR